MANDAIITIDGTVGVYIHWNGGPESVTAFLDACSERGYRDPASDPGAALARLTGLLCEFFGMHSDSCVGVGTVDQLRPHYSANGLYRIGAGWQVVEWSQGEIELDEEDQRKHDRLLKSLVDSQECLT